MNYFHEKHFMNTKKKKKKKKKIRFCPVNLPLFSIVILCLFPMPYISFYYIYRKELFLW